ncbi:hypothetical protein [Actinophytocola gossypii]|uniref:Uncharacterized protein n=1 Tax=Actinophytocola gossypii TaxID=2812003 RepID=A0ABT2JE68_9PSEU|nr:hypothetical protein [Actinophytocola gossypii]MCT2586177.1 hypothetical protein [Actinophytocola gossypii]
MKQLPRTGHGDALCKHLSPGSCTRWCSYGRFVKVCLALVVVIGGFAALSLFLDESGGLERLVDAGIALGCYTLFTVTLITVAGRRDQGDHY